MIIGYLLENYYFFQILQFDTPTLSARELNEAIEESESDVVIEESESDVPSVYYNENLNYIGHCVTEVGFNPLSCTKEM